MPVWARSELDRHDDGVAVGPGGDVLTGWDPPEDRHCRRLAVRYVGRVTSDHSQLAVRGTIHSVPRSNSRRPPKMAEIWGSVVARHMLVTTREEQALSMSESVSTPRIYNDGWSDQMS